MALKGFSTKEWRRALTEPQEEEEILQSHLSSLKINDEDCGRYHIFTDEIFPRLPANQLQTFKIVCKNWNQIISNPYFIRLHLNIYNNQSRIRVLILQNYGKPEMIEYNINNSEIKQIPIPYPPEVEITPKANLRATILGSCDGLICFYWKGMAPSIAIFNPSTGKCLCVKLRLKDNYKINCSWFGHLPCSGEYVLVLGNSDDEIGVYKFNNRGYSLQKIQSTYCGTRSRRAFLGSHEKEVGTLLHGALHWPVDKYWTGFGYESRYVISVYRFEDNKCLEISLPVHGQGRHFKLGVVNGCLFAIFKTTDAEFEMWIMKEYGVQQSWTKYANIHGFSSYRVLSPLGFFPNGDLILSVGDLMLIVDECKLIKYSFNDNKHVLLMNHRHGVPIMCADSLVSPKIVGT